MQSGNTTWIIFGRHILILVLLAVLLAICVCEYSHFYDQKFCKNRSVIKIPLKQTRGDGWVIFLSTFDRTGKRSKAETMSRKYELCNKVFSTKGNLVAHKRTHTGDKPYECDVCNKKFSQSSNLTVHKRNHTGEKPYECDVCNKRFSRSGDLARHERTHTGEKPYECDVCNKRFSRSGHLASHKRTHTGDKPYECDVCNKRFSRSDHLASHKRTHTGDKPYECDVCNKRFSHASTLTIHKRTHTDDKPYECDVCKRRFSHSSTLASHKRTHTREKPCECDVCNKRFLHSDYLAVDKRTHTGDRPYEYHIWNTKFSESHSLTRHKISARKVKQCFVCAKCKKIFAQRKHLKRHWRVHSRDGLLFCNSCGREIIQSQGQGHASEILSDDHFVCDKCNKQFPDIESLYQHKAKDHHTSYQCDVCKELEAREATGIGYICCVCDAEFEIATELEYHISMHDNVLPHK